MLFKKLWFYFDLFFNKYLTPLNYNSYFKFFIKWTFCVLFVFIRNYYIELSVIIHISYIILKQKDEFLKR